MFIPLKAKKNPSLKSWSVRKNPDGSFYVRNDEMVTYDPRPAIVSGITEAEAKQHVRMLQRGI